MILPHHRLIFLIFILIVPFSCLAQEILIHHNKQQKILQLENRKIKLTLDYNQRCAITSLEVNGQKVIDQPDGIFSEVKTPNKIYSSVNTLSTPRISIKKNKALITGISYGDSKLIISEDWTFTLTDDIKLDIQRNFSDSVWVEEVAFPAIHFNHINTWDGAFQGYGGLAWFYLFNEKLCTYGVHTDQSTFWNSKTGNGLRIITTAPGKQVAMAYTRTEDDKLAFRIAVAEKELIPRYDKEIQRRRFLRGKTDVWSAFKIKAGSYSQGIYFSFLDYNQEYDRGKFVGISEQQVNSVLNTIARIGVIDAKLFGGNSWHTPYGPACLHEQYVAQIGLAINDNAYINGYKESLNYYRDNAIQPDGRVLPRWAYNNGDIMAGKINDKGFYEAQWGYLLDSNPDFVINVVDLYNLCGDKAWVTTQVKACRMALDYLLNRDTNGNYLVEMMTESYKEKKGSDWIDIIWASFENAFINAELYHALMQWSQVEDDLGNHSQAGNYRNYASQLKASFNKSTDQGGFWDNNKGCFIHWRDKDNSIHGNNLVTPVNFMAIAYGLCDDMGRRNKILDGIENQMLKENLFFWPLCMYSYQEGEGNDWQFPFPNYENGDIFLSWGGIAVQAYAEYKPDLAMKYINNVLSQYSKDGLAFQRYGRLKQDGLGDDILAGNSQVVTGLYQAIFGINPRQNRLYLNPHLTPELEGTELKYKFRNDLLTISLAIKKYSISCRSLKIISGDDFGFYATDKKLFFFRKNETDYSLMAEPDLIAPLTLEIISWESEKKSWTQFKNRETKTIRYTIKNLKPGVVYSLTQNETKLPEITSSNDGSLSFVLSSQETSDKITLTQQ